MEHSLFLCGKKVTSIQKDTSLNSISVFLGQNYGINSTDLYLVCNGKILTVLNQSIDNNVHAGFRCNGGKGGFGSMLRAIGAQIEKTTNREACRDLSGRRLRDINEEKRLKAWLEKQKDQKADAEEKKKKKLEKLLAVPKHTFKDANYDNARSDMTEKVSEAVEEGFKKASIKPDVSSSSGIKRKTNETTGVRQKKPALWIDDELGSSSDSDSSDDDEIAENNLKNKTESESSDRSSDDKEKEVVKNDEKISARESENEEESPLSREKSNSVN